MISSPIAPHFLHNLQTPSHKPQKYPAIPESDRVEVKLAEIFTKQYDDSTQNLLKHLDLPWNHSDRSDSDLWDLDDWR